MTSPVRRTTPERYADWPVSRPISPTNSLGRRTVIVLFLPPTVSTISISPSRTT